MDMQLNVTVWKWQITLEGQLRSAGILSIKCVFRLLPCINNLFCSLFFTTGYLPGWSLHRTEHPLVKSSMRLSFHPYTEYTVKRQTAPPGPWCSTKNKNKKQVQQDRTAKDSNGTIIYRKRQDPVQLAGAITVVVWMNIAGGWMMMDSACF